MSFNESCDILDSTKWGINWTAPTVTGGQWLFDLPVGFNGTRQVFRRAMLGYGIYEIRMRMTPKVAGCNWWFYMYTAPNGEHMPGYNTLTLTQSYGARLYNVSEAIIGFNVDGRSSAVPNVGYWTIPVFTKTGINFEDGQYHLFRFEYSSTEFVAYVDGDQYFRWSVDCADKTALGIPFPPMTFIIGATANGAQTSGFTLAIDSVSYASEVVALPPVVTSFLINNGDIAVIGQAVTLNNVCSNAPTEYVASEDPAFAGAVWSPYAVAPAFALSTGTGAKTVYFKVRNASGESAVISDTITVETTLLPPVATAFSINNGGNVTTSQNVFLNNACTGNPTDYMASEDEFFLNATWQAYSNAPAFILSAGAGVKTVYFKARNSAGESSALFDAITLDVSAPPAFDWKILIVGIGLGLGSLLLLATGKKRKKL